MVDVQDRQVNKATPARNSDEIDFKQCGDVRRIQSGRFLKGGELILHEKKCLAREAELVRRRHNHPTAGTAQTNHFAHQSARVLKMLAIRCASIGSSRVVRNCSARAAKIEERLAQEIHLLVRIAKIARTRRAGIAETPAFPGVAD
jgi:hypothetical protein